LHAYRRLRDIRDQVPSDPALTCWIGREGNRNQVWNTIRAVIARCVSRDHPVVRISPNNVDPGNEWLYDDELPALAADPIVTFDLTSDSLPDATRRLLAHSLARSPLSPGSPAVVSQLPSRLTYRPSDRVPTVMGRHEVSDRMTVLTHYITPEMGYCTSVLHSSQTILQYNITTQPTGIENSTFAFRLLILEKYSIIRNIKRATPVCPTSPLVFRLLLLWRINEFRSFRYAVMVGRFRYCTLTIEL